MTTVSETESAARPLTLHLLGAFALQLHGQPAPALSRAARSLLAFLAIRSPRPVDRETLAVTLWPDSDDEAARYNLRRTTTELRGALGSEAGRLISNTRSVLALDFADGGYCDVLEFDRAIAAKTDDGLEMALDLYDKRGSTLLEGERGEWILVEREERALAYLAARERLAARFGERGEWQEAIRHLRAILVLDPTRETAVRDLMRALGASGQSAAALAAYGSLRNRLRIDSSAAPDAETTALYKQLLAEAKRREAAPKWDPSRTAGPRSGQPQQAGLTGDEADDDGEVSGKLPTQFPTGAVTFLFTDVEGSTRGWQVHPEAMRLALLRHDRLVQDAILAANGVVFKSVGDGFCAAFTAPTDAAAAAIAAQRSLQSEPWPGTTPIRVRMAIHTGAAELRDGDYFGNTVNRSSRFLAAGHGGQVLVSSASHELLRDFLPPGVALLSLGKQWLRDIDRPEEIFALTHPDLPEPDSFPPLRTLESTSLPNNLPRSATSFVGREREMADVTDMLSKASLLTLVGTGGTGKTRLALQVAATVLENYPDGAWLVELASITEPDLVPQSVAQALGVKEQAGEAIGDTLIGYLASKRLLILLDNCEHVIEACARLTASLLRACSGLTVLATSREPLGISGEQSYRVPPLSLPDPKATIPTDVKALNQYESVRLFIERASLVKPGFAVTNANAPALAQLCFHLDGIPLALELAAARIRSLSVVEINDRLGGRFRLLTSGDRAALPRQQTLRALIDWSYDLLSAREKTLFARLSVFAGGWTLSAAEAVSGFEPLEEWEVLDLLTSLVDKSLVVADEAGEGTRYRMLESLRQYAAEKSDMAGETTLLRDRHRDRFLALAEEARLQLLRSTALEWHTRLEYEHDNLRASLAWCALRASEDQEASLIGLRMSASLLRFWLTRGYLSEGREQLNRALGEWRKRLPDPLGDPDSDVALKEPRLRTVSTRDWKIAAANALTASSVLANAQGDSAAVMPILAESLALGQETGDRKAVANSLGALGTAAFNRGDFAEARLRNTEALRIYRELGDRWSIASSLNNIGTAASDQGDYDTAGALFAESLAIRREIGEPSAIADSLNNMGIVVFRQGDLAGARAQYEESMAIKRMIGDKYGVANSLSNLSLIASATGDYSGAAALLEESLRLRKEIGDKRSAADTLDNLGAVRFFQNDMRAAYAMFEEALTVRREVGNKKGIAGSLGNLGETAAMLGDNVRARELQLESLAMHRETGNKLGAAIALLNLGLVHVRDADYESARTYCCESLSLFREIGYKAGMVNAFSQLAELHLTQGSARRAVVMHAAADTLRSQVGLSQRSTEIEEAEAFLKQAHGVLDDAAFSTAWHEGCALTWDEATDFALAQSGDLSSSP